MASWGCLAGDSNNQLQKRRETNTRGKLSPSSTYSVSPSLSSTHHTRTLGRYQARRFTGFAADVKPLAEASGKRTL